MARLKEEYERCIEDYQIIRIIETDKDKINTFLKTSDDMYSSISEIKEKYTIKTLLLYSAIHMLCEAIAEKDRIHTQNHRCLFVYICSRYNIRFEILDNLRILRNNINYEGRFITKADFEKNLKELKKIYDKLKSIIQ